MPSAIPAGPYKYKVAINNSWTENYGAGGVPNGINIVAERPRATDRSRSSTTTARTG